jgi:hypothetical protein
MYFTSQRIKVTERRSSAADEDRGRELIRSKEGEINNET